MTQQNKPGYGMPEDQKQHARDAANKGGKQDQHSNPKREASGQPSQNPQRPNEPGNKHQH